MTTEISFIINRDLDRLAEEIRAFKQEEDLWKVAGQIANPAGNLCLHLVGNLNTYIGAILGGSGYVRNREAEFSQKDIPKADLLHTIQEVKAAVSYTLEKLQEEQLQEIYPQQVLGYEMTTGFFLLHLSGHLNYHLGQINYLRRMLE
jgi:uncharacterized damage-inducible protein DinB